MGSWYSWPAVVVWPSTSTVATTEDYLREKAGEVRIAGTMTPIG
jgi:hypothetical protein